MRGRLLGLACALLLARGQAGLAMVGDQNASKSPKASEGRLPADKKFRLDNGLEVRLVERHGLPVLALHLVIRTGTMADPPGKEGLATMTGTLLTKGSATRDAPQIAEDLDFLGASLAAGVDVDKTVLRLDVLKKDLKTGLALFSDALLTPSFPESELIRERQNVLAGLKTSMDDANAVVEAAANQTTYGSYPYGRLQSGTESSLPRLSIADVRQFYRQYYQPDNALLVVVGDTTPVEIGRLLEEVIGRWAGKAAEFRPPPPPSPTRDRLVRLVDMDVSQAYIKLENIAIPRGHADYFPAMLMSYILGGGPVARLFKDIRDTQGLAYGASSYLVPRFYTGKITLELQTKLPTTDRALNSLIAAMGKMRELGPTEEEMALAKDYFVGSFSLRLESSDDMAREITNLAIYGLGDDYLLRYPQRIRGLTRSQVHEAARKYLHPDRYALTIVAKAADLEGRLFKFGKVVRVSRDSLIK